MSLTSFIKMSDVAAKVKPLRPKLSRKIPDPIWVEPRGDDFRVVGTAFDYLLRFELQRRAPHASAGQWVAELAPDLIPNIIEYWWESDDGPFPLSDEHRGMLFDEWLEKGAVTDEELCDEMAVYAVRINKELSPEDARRQAAEVVRLKGSDDARYEELEPKIFRLVGGEELHLKIAARVRRVVKNARWAVAKYLKLKKPSRANRGELAAHALRLAHLDDVIRAGHLDPGFEEANTEDVEDLLAMLAVVPFDELMHDSVMLLNPNFEGSSALVGGADTDLITGDMLVDFKTTKCSAMRGSDLDQLLGYYLLARHRRRVDPQFPAVNRVALYFCRHGHLWILDVSAWTDLPEFPAVEQWFWQRAGETFRSAA